jgi:hypothetical protein
MDPVAYSRDLREQSARLAERMAAMEEMVAATLLARAERAAPDRAAYLLAQSEEARERAARLRHRYPST